MISALPKSNFVRVLVLVWCCSLSLKARAQTLGTGDTISIPFGKLFLGVLLCALFAFVTVYIVKVLFLQNGKSVKKGLFLGGKLRNQNTISVLETKRVSSHADVCLLENAGQEYLILISAQQFLVLREGETPSDHGRA